MKSRLITRLRRVPGSHVLIYQSLGFIAIMALTWLDELVALPSLLFGDHAVIVDFRDSALRMLLVLVVWLLVLGSTRRVLARLRDVEEFMRICAWCHRIDFKGEWVPLEEFLHRGFDTPTTHGICPRCLAKQKAAIARASTARNSEATA